MYDDYYYTLNHYDCSNGNSHSYNSITSVAVMRTPARKNQPGTRSDLYKLAARNLREYHGVSSMTALKLEKTQGSAAPCSSPRRGAGASTAKAS